MNNNIAKSQLVSYNYSIKMKGLEQVYLDLDNTRHRVTRLVDMERLTPEEGGKLVTKLLKLMDEVSNLIPEEEYDI